LIAVIFSDLPSSGNTWRALHKDRNDHYLKRIDAKPNQRQAYSRAKPCGERPSDEDTVSKLRSPSNRPSGVDVSSGRHRRKQLGVQRLRL
jgi:hypothetical protein